MNLRGKKIGTITNDLLNKLRSKLITAGFSNISFIIINTRNATNKYDRLTNVSGEIPVYQETIEDQTYETLGAAKDHILVVDKCNRLTYQVIMPWSILRYPYVKAAILSTYKDDPCGACQEGKLVINENQEPTNTEVERNRTMEELLLNTTFTDETSTQLEEKNNEIKKESKNETIENSPDTQITNNQAEANETQESVIPDCQKSTKNETEAGGDTHHEMGHGDDGMQGDEPRDDFNNFSEQNQQTLLDYSGKDEKNKFYSPALEEIIKIEQTNGSQKRNPLNWKKRTEKKVKTKKTTPFASNNSNEEALKAEPTSLKIILNYPHYHSSGKSVTAHDYLVLQMGKPNYHGHIDAKTAKAPESEVDEIKSDTQQVHITKKESDNITTSTESFLTQPEESSKEEMSDVLHTKVFNENIPEEISATRKKIWRDYDDSEVEKTEEKAEGKPISPAVEKVPEEEESSEALDKLIEHYSKLMSWVYYGI